MQVSTAVRLCDGALVVVDAVEGVCVQTHAVLRQAWAERVTPALVINKVDRLVSELQLTPAEAYERLGRIVEEANSVLAALTSAQFLQRADESAEAEHAECAPHLSLCFGHVCAVTPPARRCGCIACPSQGLRKGCMIGSGEVHGHVSCGLTAAVRLRLSAARLPCRHTHACSTCMQVV